jgi:hypothetical protein
MTHYLFMLRPMSHYQDFAHEEADTLDQALAQTIAEIRADFVPQVADEVIACLDGCDVYEVPPKQYLTLEQYRDSMDLLTANDFPLYMDATLAVMHDFCNWAANRGLTYEAVIGIAYVMRRGVDLGLPLLVKGLVR